MATDSLASIRVLCAGILVADVFVPPMAALPESGELIATEDFLLDTGGCAANVATSLVRLGVDTAVCGRVGGDTFGDFIVDDLQAKGVDVSSIRRPSQAGTSKTVILPVIGEDRRYIHTFGANAEFTSVDIPLELFPHIEVLYLGGFLILPGLVDAAGLFRAAQERGIKTVLDVVVPAGEVSSAMRSLAEILPFTDYFLPNDEEARALTSLSDPYEQAQMFREMGCDTVLITEGNCGTLLVSGTESLEAPAYGVDVVDGSGAGDAFAAGLIAGLIEGWRMPRTLRYASAIGASACRRLGCTPGVFTPSEADVFIRRNPLEIRMRRF